MSPDRPQSLHTLQRCQELAPALVGAPILGEWAGLRPIREGGIRLERASCGVRGVPVLYNYGHGGSGVVVSWGCAAEVVHLAHQVAHERGQAHCLVPKAVTPLLPPPGERTAARL